jgi:HlyD family secretion protein
MFPLLAALLACTSADLGDLPTAVATRGPFELTLSVPGELKAENSVSIAAPELRVDSIKVTEIVEEGTRVEPGDVMVVFDQVALERELASATAELEVSLTKIKQQRSQLAVRLSDAQGEVTRAELGKKRAEMRVTDATSVPLVEREGARLDVIEHEMGIVRARSALESVRLQGEAEIQLLELSAEEAQRRLDAAKEQLEMAVVKAPAAGLVILNEVWKGGSYGTVAVGDTVWGGSSIIELPDLSSMQVIAWVHEVDSSRVAVGQTAKVVVDAYPDPPHTGRVSKVADLAVQRDSYATVKHLKVTIDLDATTPVMKPGMTVRGDLLIERLEDVVSVPIEAIGREEEETWVWVRGYRGWDRHPVTLGRENDTHVVIEGLEPKTEVALIDPERFARGERPGAAAEEKE